MIVAGVPVRKYRHLDLPCPECGRRLVYSYAPRPIPSPDLYGVDRSVVGTTGWIVACDHCPPWMPMATGETETAATEAFKKRAIVGRNAALAGKR